ncbi:TPA: cell surface protein, partial [Streptococcus suis]|nr:cell surface protein [Streptococcus suis]
MSKQKVVSSLLLSTVVLGGLAFYSTTTVKAESLEPDVTSVSSGDVVEKPVISNEEGGDFLAEEEIEESDAPVETLNEEIKDVTEPESVLRPRAMRSVSETSDMEKIPVDDEFSDYTEEKVIGKQAELIQSSNADSKTGGDKETIKKSVTVNLLNAEEGQIQWEVRFDTSAWSFKESPGGFYFVLPKGLELTEIIDNDHGKMNIINNFPKNVNVPENAAKKKYRFFSEEEDQRSFNNQWGWSVGQATPDTTVNSWKSDNRFSKIYFVDQITDTTQVTYTLTAKVTTSDKKSFPLMAVMKTFGYKNWSWTEVTSLGAREIILEKEKPLPPKETPAPEAPLVPKEEPKKEEPQTPQAPSTPEKQPEETPKVPESPKEDTPAPPAPSVPEEPQTPPAPEAPTEEPKETPKPEMPEAPQAPSTPKEEAPKEEVPTPPAPSVPEEQPKETPTPEVPKQEDVQPEAPKSDKVETDKLMPETKQPDMKQPKADDMPKEQKPKADEPKAEQPQMDKPQMDKP